MDVTYFAERGTNPRDIIKELIPDTSVRVLDLCCGTFANGLSIAKENPNNKVIGIDLNKDMLKEGRRKVKKAKVKNVYLRAKDATDTGLPSKSFDYIIIGLCLHECEPDLRCGILGEAMRLLKPDGRLIILEWEREDSLIRRIKYFPLYVAEIAVCKYFTSFYNYDKSKYFEELGFDVVSIYHCNYTCVLELKRKCSNN